MTEADIQSAAVVQAQAFGSSPAHAEEQFRAGARYTWRDGWVVEVDGRVRASAVAIKATLWFGGVAHPISGVAAVGVADADRRQGYASALVRAILEADRAAGRRLSLLYPFMHGFYRRLGYASVGLANFWRIPTADLPDNPALRRSVRAVTPADRASIESLYSGWLRQTDGGLQRNAAQWRLRWADNDERWVAFETDRLHGYLAYRPIEGSLQVRELVALTSDAERGLWAFLAAQVEQRPAITYLAPVDRPFWAMLREPLMFDAANRGFVVNDAAALTMSFMARVVDVPAFLAAHAFPSQLHGSLRLELQDPTLGSAGPLDLHLADGRASVEPTSRPADARCDVVTFSQLCCGALSAELARRYGLLEATDAATELLERAFTHRPPFIQRADWF